MRGPPPTLVSAVLYSLTLKTNMDERFTYLISLRSALLMFHIFILTLHKIYDAGGVYTDNGLLMSTRVNIFAASYINGRMLVTVYFTKLCNI